MRIQTIIFSLRLRRCGGVLQLHASLPNGNKRLFTAFICDASISRELRWSIFGDSIHRRWHHWHRCRWSYRILPMPIRRHKCSTLPQLADVAGTRLWAPVIRTSTAIFSIWWTFWLQLRYSDRSGGWLLLIRQVLLLLIPQALLLRLTLKQSTTFRLWWHRFRCGQMIWWGHLGYQSMSMSVYFSLQQLIEYFVGDFVKGALITGETVGNTTRRR